MPTDTLVNDLKINVLSEAQYEQIQSPSATELYLVPEVVDTTPTSGSTNPITSGGVYDALQNIPEQEQSDWNETDTTDPAYIKNKPTIPTNAADVSALPSSTKYAASLYLSVNSSTYVVTAQLKDQDGNNIGASQTIDLPLESVVVSGSYNAQTKKVVLTLQNGSTIEFSVADLVAGLQSEITAQNPLSADLVVDGTTNMVFTLTMKTKLDDIEAGAEVNVQSDWNQSDNTADDFIKNKPTIPTVPTHRTINHEQITDSSLGDANLHDGFYFPNAYQDYDGNWYGAVVIGDQVWLGENLRTKHLPDGTEITSGDPSTTALHYKDYTSHSLPVEKRGLLYSYAVTASIAPQGWKFPSESEFAAMAGYLGKQTRYSSAVAKAMTATSGWTSSETTNAVGNDQTLNNASGFNMYPTGTVNSSGSFVNENISTIWASTNKGVYIYGGSVVYYSTSYAAGSWSLAIRLLSTMTPIQFRDWYVKTYGTMQHNVLSSELSAGRDIVITPQSQYVPEGFEELEYIESTGTQWLNSYVVLGYDNTVSIKIVAQGTGDRGLICGFDQDWGGSFLGDNGSKYYMEGLLPSDERNTSNSLLKATLSSTWVSTSSQYTQSGSIDDVSNTVYTSSRLKNINLELLLFRANAWTTADSYWAGRIFECKIWRKGTLARNFVPARRILDNVVGLYETVNKEFYGNRGTGVFNAGPTVAIGTKTIISYTGIEIPELTDNSRKVLAVNSGATGVEWVRPVTVYSGSSEPSASLGEDGDIFILAS